MNSDTSLTQWLDRFKAGDEQAVKQIWNSCFNRMVKLAKNKLRNGKLRVADEEDMAISAFKSFCKAAEVGRFPQLENSNDLWQILIMITVRKVAEHQRRALTQKRGAGNVRGESVFVAGDKQEDPGMQGVAGMEMPPEIISEMNEQCESLLAGLNDELRAIAVLKMEGYTNAEIAVRIERKVVTVERKLRLIRETWKNLGSVQD